MARGLTLMPPEPRRSTQMSPGISRISTNTTAAAPTSVGIRSSTRFTIYLCILCVRSSASMPVSGCGRASRRGGGLLVEPHVGQVLIEVVARTDLPSLYVGAQRNDPVPVGHHHLVRLGIEHALLEIAHQRPLLRAVRLTQHLLVQIDQPLIFVVAVVLGEDRMR